MKLFKVSCTSECGSYFTSYLQSLTVVANSAEDAIRVAEEWLDKQERSFIYSKDKWRVTFIADIVQDTVVDQHEDSDY
jgi:hypothetical protein